VLATYVFILKDNDTEAVGYITAVLGLSQLLTSFPTGFCADKYRRDRILFCASFVGCLAFSVTLLACWHENYTYLVWALATWGAYYGVTNTTLGALYADSIPQGDRSYYFTHRSSVLSMANICGPVVALTMFAHLGDRWTVRDCVVVMAVGQCISLPGFLMLCLFNDPSRMGNVETIEEEPCQGDDDTRTDSGLSEAEDGTADNESDVGEDQETGFLCISQERILPAQIAGADVISGLASGMSIRYFPIFFVDHLKLNPVHVQCLYICSPLCMVFLMRAAQRLAQRFGRLHIVVLHKWVGVIFMFAMIGAYMTGFHSVVVCTLYVLRTAFMNSTGALSRSMLMDYVSTTERGKWSALESVNMFTWSGSAALGGLLVGKLGILPVFALTAILQIVGTLPLIPLFSQDEVERSNDTED